MLLEELTAPVLLAPLAGGPSTPELAAAVTEAGGLGFLASGYLSVSELATGMGRVRSQSTGPLAVNLFVPETGPTPPAVYEAYVRRLAAWAEREGLELGRPTYGDDDWPAKLELLREDPPEVVSFTFGCPTSEVMRHLRAGGSECWVTVTNAHEARLAAQAGADVLIAQGAEAGGHRASFVDRPDVLIISLLPLLALIRDTVELSVVASGGLATGAGVAAVLAAGAAAAQVGTAFMLAPEAGTAAAHRAALRGDAPTLLTRAFTGRLARGIRNQFTAAHSEGAPVAYPEVHYVTAPMRRRAREDGNAELINLWAGEAHQLAMELPAAEIVRRLAADAEAAGQ